MKALKRCYLGWIHGLKYVQPVFLLVVRVVIGWGFLLFGWGKLTNIAATAAYFGKLGIPQPTLNAWAAGLSETVGGACLILGLASRITTLPLIGTMIVAYVTADHVLFTGIDPHPACLSIFIQKFIKSDEFPYLLVALVVSAVRAGAAVGGRRAQAVFLLSEKRGPVHERPDSEPAQREPAGAGGPRRAGGRPATRLRPLRSPTGGSPAAKGMGDDNLPLLLHDPHVCRGINTCKDKGKVGTTNECAGQGHCPRSTPTPARARTTARATAAATTTPARTSAAARALHVPLSVPKFTWHKARIRFEELMPKYFPDKKVGPSRPRVELAGLARSASKAFVGVPRLRFGLVRGPAMNPTHTPQHAFPTIQRWMQTTIMHPDGVVMGMNSPAAAKKSTPRRTRPRRSSRARRR